MGLGRPAHQRHIAPADDLAIGRDRDELGMAAPDIVEHERPRRLERRGFQERQISPLPRHDIEGAMKAVDMALGYRDNFDRVHVPAMRPIPPLAEWPGNNYLGFDPPTTECP